MADPVFACDMSVMTAEERATHLGCIRLLFGAVRAIEETPAGYVFRLAAEAEVLTRAAEFVALERRCCPFFGFSLELEPGGRWVRLGVWGPEGVKPFIQEEFAAALPSGIGFPASLGNADEPLTLHVLPGRLAICRLPPDALLPDWAHAGGFACHARTMDELSVICAQDAVPEGVRATRGWRALKLQGPFDFGLVGVLLRVARPLAEAGISIMPVATYDTDYVLVAEADLERAVQALGRAGHRVRATGA